MDIAWFYVGTLTVKKDWTALDAYVLWTIYMSTCVVYRCKFRNLDRAIHLCLLHVRIVSSRIKPQSQQRLLNQNIKTASQLCFVYFVNGR